MNEKHYHGEPCEKCRSTVRYKSTRNCVTCAKLAVRKKRGTGKPLSDGSDLFGDLDGLRRRFHGVNT